MIEVDRGGDGDSTPVVHADDWPYTKTDELEFLLARFYRPAEFDTIGDELDIEWFEQNLARDDRSEAQTAIAEHVADGTPLESIVDLVEPTAAKFPWFRGYHYEVTLDTEAPSLSTNPPVERCEEVVADVERVAADDEKLNAFLRGIVGADGTFNGSVLTDFTDAMARGSTHYDDGQLWVSTHADTPAQVTGISTRSSQSGRTYSVAVELAPVIEATLNHLNDRAGTPVATPEQTVPETIDRRIPKFREVLEGVTVTRQDIERFESILADHDALDYWADYVAPTVKFRGRAKRAILCLLASPEDEHGTKGRTNAILFGPPGTGKSAFKNFLVEEFGAFSIDGARVSKADLTYNKNTDEDGLLVRSHKGLAVIEEADELDDDALGAALTALGEAGRIEISDLRLPAEVRGILLGNYRSREAIVDTHSEAVFNRFEFVLHFDRLTESERDEAIDWQYDHFRQSKSPENTAAKYIAWVREFDPDVPEAELDRIKRYKQRRIDVLQNVREGISVLTVAYTIARLNHRELTLSDYETAFDLVTRDGD